ncbi:hypothetical protein OKA05_14745 [Luteolibacter arcticus]|uniref:Lipoprotein n=1 Tax=Luteolibacter arcticus TaxID=1581411 RepID=A0ABT3GJX5_9BACT|nr:hypothetical protein [Luteolibacter arcticus]MCW1923823.1 hypothetical protein [Luteolibacter arcticus]
MKKAVFTAVIVGLTSCNKVTVPSGSAMTEVEVRNAIKKDATLELPPTSKMVEFAHGGQLVDPSWAARFSVLPGAKAALAPKISALDKKVKSSGGITTTLPWWKPGTIVAEAAFEPQPDSFVRVILSEEGGQFFLYLEDEQ